MDETGQPGAPTPGEHGNGAGPQGDPAHPNNGWAADAGWPGAENGDPAGRPWRQPAEAVHSPGWADRSYPVQSFPAVPPEHRQPVNGVHLGEAGEVERGWPGGRGVPGEPSYPYGPEPADPYARRSPDEVDAGEPAWHGYGEREPVSTPATGQPPRWGEPGTAGHPGPISGPPAAAVSGPPVPASAPPMQVSGPPAQISGPPAGVVRERTALMPAVPRQTDRPPTPVSGAGQAGSASGAWPVTHPVERGAPQSGPGTGPAGPGYPPGDPDPQQSGPAGADDPEGAWSARWAPPWAAPASTAAGDPHTAGHAQTDPYPGGGRGPTDQHPGGHPVDQQTLGHGQVDAHGAGYGAHAPHTVGGPADPQISGPGPADGPAAFAPAGQHTGGFAPISHATGYGPAGDPAEPVDEFRDGGHRRDVEQAPDQGWSPPGWANQAVQRLPVQRQSTESPAAASRDSGHRDDQTRQPGYDDHDPARRAGYEDHGQRRGYDDRAGYPAGPTGQVGGADAGSHRAAPEGAGQHTPAGPGPAQHPDAPGYLPGPGGLLTAPAGHPARREALALPPAAGAAGPAPQHPPLSAAGSGPGPHPAEQGMDVLPQRIPAEPDVPTVPEPAVVEPSAETPELARIATHLRREDGPVQPAERPDGFDVDAIVAAVQGVPGVRTASVRATPAGAHSLRLDLADGADPAEVSRQVARLLQERMGLAAAPQNLPDTPAAGPTRTAGRAGPGAAPPRPAPTAVPRQSGTYGTPSTAPGTYGGSGSTAPGPYGTATDGARRRRPAPARGRASAEQPEATSQAEAGRSAGLGATTVGTSYSGSPVTTTESAPSRPLNPGSPPGPRVIIDHVQVSTFGLDATVEVRLAAGDNPAAGLATGPAVDGYVLRLCAVAAAAAIDELLSSSTRVTERGRCFVEHAAVVPFGSCEVATVVVLLVCDGWVEQLAGSALVAGDPRQAVVRATLAAVNRRLEALLT